MSAWCTQHANRRPPNHNTVPPTTHRQHLPPHQPMSWPASAQQSCCQQTRLLLCRSSNQRRRTTQISACEFGLLKQHAARLQVHDRGCGFICVLNSRMCAVPSLIRRWASAHISLSDHHFTTKPTHTFCHPKLFSLVTRASVVGLPAAQAPAGKKLRSAGWRECGYAPTCCCQVC